MGKLMWPIAIAVVILAGLPPGARAQQPVTVSGRVTNTTGQPVPVASVSIAQLGVGGITSDDGRYTFSVPASAIGRQLTIAARSIGYRPMTSTITVGDGANTMDFMLTVAPTRLSEVVVTALGIERPKASVGTAQQQVNGEELSAARETNIVNALSGKSRGSRSRTPGPRADRRAS